jgi:hypothetical protein
MVLGTPENARTAPGQRRMALNADNLPACGTMWRATDCRMNVSIAQKYVLALCIDEDQNRETTKKAYIYFWGT